VWIKHVETEAEQLFRESALNEIPQDWSQDGRFILYRDGLGALWASPLEGDQKPITIASSGNQGVFSPDGKRVAYVSSETGRAEVVVVSFPVPGVPIQVSAKGGANPKWRADGREIFYLAPNKELTAVPLVPGGNAKLEVGTPAALFPIPEGANSYDITHDGQRILIVRQVGQATTPPITVIHNWKHKP
jgi:hypothetical protein